MLHVVAKMDETHGDIYYSDFLKAGHRLSENSIPATDIEVLAIALLGW